MANPKIRALVVDDSALYRKFVSSALCEIPGVEVVGTASNGRLALQKFETLKPDLITLDQEMPELDGLGLLREFSVRNIKVATIMISSATEAGAKTTNTALQLGAFDFVLKPVGLGPEDSRLKLTAEITPKIEAYVSTRRNRSPQACPVRRPASQASVDRRAKPVGATHHRPKIVGIGVSTGGPAALNKLLPQLPEDFPCPIVVVQHMPPNFTKSLADDLNRLSALEVMEAADGMVAKAGEVLIAPGGSQMRISKLGEKAIVQITDDPPERNCKPAVDYLFRSIANNYGDRSIGIVLTGMGDDGTEGCGLLKNKGARVLTQDEASCVVYGMPRCVFEAGYSDKVASLNDMPKQIMNAVRQGTYA
ncbi:MAG: chemotaxis response regulator protein-glutamate methylesterase [Planctomycetota bacterium]